MTSFSGSESEPVSEDLLSGFCSKHTLYSDVTFSFSGKQEKNLFFYLFLFLWTLIMPYGDVVSL